MANSNPISSITVAKALVGGPARPRRSLIRRRGRRHVESHVFLAEHYVASVDGSRLDDLARDVAAAGVRRRGRDVFLLGILGLPSEESLMSLFSAPAADAVAGTLERAGVPADRIVPVLWREGRHSRRG